MPIDLDEQFDQDEDLRLVLDARRKRIPRRRKGAKPGIRKCIICEKLFNSLDPSDRFCQFHKIAKWWKMQEYYGPDDWGGGLGF